jgi:LPS-assembly lipoprotein
MNTLRRRHFNSLLTLAAVAVLSASLASCGFHLRGAMDFAFDTVAVTPETGGAVAPELIRVLGDRIRPVAPKQDQEPPQVILDILSEGREKVVVGVNASGQVREFQLRMRVRFRMRTPQGRILIAATEVTQQRDISFSEATVLSKEAEETMLFRDMQSDIVQQLLRRMAAVKTLSPADPASPPKP